MKQVVHICCSALCAGRGYYYPLLQSPAGSDHVFILINSGRAAYGRYGEFAPAVLDALPSALSRSERSADTAAFNTGFLP